MTAPSPYERLMPAFTAYQSRVLVTNFGGFNVVRSFADLLVANSGDSDIAINTDIVLTANITITKPLWMLEGGTITTNGYTLTINAPFNCGAVRCFITSAGKVVFGSNSTLYILMEWFGATGDGSTDDTAAIQLAFDASILAVEQPSGNYINIPVYLMHSKIYRLSSVNVPARLKVVGGDERRAQTGFKANSASAMFVYPSALSNYARFITFEGVTFNGNSQAASICAVKNSQNSRWQRCQFREFIIALDMTYGGAIWNYVDHCEFNGVDIGATTTYGVKISGICNETVISECAFAGDINYPIVADSSWAGDCLNVQDCTFDQDGSTDIIGLDHHAVSGNPQLNTRIIGNRIDAGAFNAHIRLGVNIWSAVVYANSIVDEAVYNLHVAGKYCFIGPNHLADSTTAAIALTADSDNCTVALQSLGNYVGTTYTDAGTSNTFERIIEKGTTAQRPTPLATEYGRLYLDTTLDADGKPIWWNGTAWVDATGAVV